MDEVSGQIRGHERLLAGYLRLTKRNISERNDLDVIRHEVEIWCGDKVYGAADYHHSWDPERKSYYDKMSIQQAFALLGKHLSEEPLGGDMKAPSADALMRAIRDFTAKNGASETLQVIRRSGLVVLVEPNPFGSRF
jgi:hypothetical protein